MADNEDSSGNEDFPDGYDFNLPLLLVAGGLLIAVTILDISMELLHTEGARANIQLVKEGH